MRSLSQTVMILLTCSFLATAQAPLPYRLLSQRTPDSADRIKEYDFNVAVDKYLEVAEVRNVICSLIRDTKPRAYDVLSVGIYYRLERYTLQSDELADASSELRQRRLAQYHWSKDSPNDSRRLAVMRDGKGQALPEWRFNNFDHARSCR